MCGVYRGWVRVRVSLAGTAHGVEFENGRHLVVPVVLTGVKIYELSLWFGVEGVKTVTSTANGTNTARYTELLQD